MTFYYAKESALPVCDNYACNRNKNIQKREEFVDAAERCNKNISICTSQNAPTAQDVRRFETHVYKVIDVVVNKIQPSNMKISNKHQLSTHQLFLLKDSRSRISVWLSAITGKRKIDRNSRFVKLIRNSIYQLPCDQFLEFAKQMCFENYSIEIKLCLDLHRPMLRCKQKYTYLF